MHIYIYIQAYVRISYIIQALVNLCVMLVCAYGARVTKLCADQTLCSGVFAFGCSVFNKSVFTLCLAFLCDLHGGLGCPQTLCLETLNTVFGSP